jgi:(hydroxyamino)benzene mutase
LGVNKSEGIMNLSLFRHGFVLILLSLIGGFFVPAMAVPRLGLSAHTIGILGGVLVIAIGVIWQHFKLSSAQVAWLKWSWLYSSYANWFACIVGAVLGAGKMTPLASAGLVGTDMAEALMAALFGSVGVASLIAVGLSLWGLRTQATVAAQQTAPVDVAASRLRG